MTAKSSNYYTPESAQLSVANESLIKGHPSNYSNKTKFYRNVTLVVQEECLVKINNSVVTVKPEFGLTLSADKDKEVYELCILQDNIPYFYMGSW